MRLVTFQPKHVLDTIHREGKYVREFDSILEDRIFCIKVDEFTTQTLFHTAPTMPQVRLILEVDESRIETLNYVNWVNYIAGLCKFYNDNVDKAKYKEYAIRSILLEDIQDILIVSKSDDEDKVQDDFFNTHYKDFEELSGYKWRNMGDYSTREWLESYDAMYVVDKITSCMIPHYKITEEDVDEVHELIISRFRGKKINSSISALDKLYNGIKEE